MTIWVGEILNRSDNDSDRCFNNLHGSLLHILHSMLKHQSLSITVQLKTTPRQMMIFFIHVMTPTNKPFTVKHTFFTYGSGISPLLPRSSIAVHHFSSFCSTTINISFFLKLRSSSSCGGRCKNAVRKTAHIIIEHEKCLTPTA